MAFQADKYKENGPAGREAYKQITQTDGSNVSVPYVAVHADLGFSGGGGGGGGGAVTIADGADVALGTTTDAAYSSGAGTVIAILKGIFGRLVGLPSAIGQQTMANSTGVVIASNQSAVSVTDTRLPSALGRATMSASLPVAIASNQGSLAVTEADGANTTLGAKADTAWDGSAGSPTVVAILKYFGAKIEAVRALLAGTIVTSTADGGNTAIGSTTDAAITSNTTGSLSGKLRGLVAWAYGRMPAALGQTTMSGSLPVAVASDNVLTAGGTTALISVTPAVTASSAYASGNAVGAKQTLTNAVRVSGGTGLLQSIIIIDKGNQKAPLDILIFDSDPSVATITDKTAFAYSTDISKLIRRVSIAASDYVTTNSIAVAEISAIGKVLKASGSANLYVAIVTTGTPTFASTSDIIVRFGILQD